MYISLHSPKSLIKVTFFPLNILYNIGFGVSAHLQRDLDVSDSHFTDKNRSSRTNCWGVVCRARLDLPALLSSGYLPFEIPSGMKIN